MTKPPARKTRKRSPTPSAPPPPAHPLTTVAVGSSAGGLSPLVKLFSALPGDLGAAYVVISHLDPSHPSELVAILSRHASMPVREVSGRLPLEADRVYVIPPSRRLSIADGFIEALPFEEPRGRRAPIDQFFRSLAERQVDGFAIVLSGSGSDGSIGIRAVKEAGGLVLVQDPDEAEYASMPRSAIDTGCVDVVLPIEPLADKLAELVRAKCHPNSFEGEGSDDTVRRIMAHLRSRTGHDFSNYKRPTIMRRLTRRMQLNRFESPAEYLAFLKENAEETKALFGDLLISVTTFFRDHASFAALAKEAVPDLMTRAPDGEPVRAWIPGCATGEEAYSVAMLLLEESAKHEPHPAIQIFASDLDAAALNIAREGRYPTSIEADVSEERLRRFFTREGDHYCIRKEVRDLVVFATHSLLKDPPFSHLDLISCRNLLIYLEREVQNQVLNTLHYALNPGGYLFLGSAETADSTPGLFRALDRQQRIYQAIEHDSDYAPVLPRLTLTPMLSDQPRGRTPQTAGAPRDVTQHRKALEQFSPPSLLVDADHRVLHLSETAGRFLQPAAGPPSSAVMQLVRAELKPEVLKGLHLAFDKGEPSLSYPIPVRFNGTPQRVIVQVRPLARDGRPQEALVLFIEGGPVETDGDSAQAAVGHAAPGVKRLEEDLQHAREQLRVSREEYEAANEELRAANEELQSINEEYRSTAEELETSKEELQSMNEELQTLNSELKLKLDSISHANSDLQNLMAATEGGTLFLDSELRIKRFTPRIVEHFNVTAGDQGRPITDFTHKLKYDSLVDDARTVLRDLTPIEREIENSHGRWLLVRIRPYRTVEDKIDGVVISFVEVTELRDAKESLRESEQRFRALLSAISYAVYRMSPDWSEMRELAGGDFIADTTSPSTTWLDKYILPEDQTEVMRVVQEALTSKQIIQLEHRVRRRDGSVGWTLSRAIPLLDRKGQIIEWIGAASDITERKTHERRLQHLTNELDHRVKNVLARVLAVIERTRSNPHQTMDDLCTALDARIRAMARTHSLLSHGHWAGASLKSICEGEIAPYLTGSRSRVTGSDIFLNADAAQTLTMVLHELATNAAKHGAFSVPNGFVEIEISIRSDEKSKQRAAVIDWVEKGGPSVKPPDRNGFGLETVKQLAPYELDAKINLAFENEGVHCTITIPLDKAEADGRGNDVSA